MLPRTKPLQSKLRADAATVVTAKAAIAVAESPVNAAGAAVVVTADGVTGAARAAVAERAEIAAHLAPLSLLM